MIDYTVLIAALHVDAILVALVAAGAAFGLLRAAILGVRHVLYTIEFRRSEHYADWRKSLDRARD